MTAPTSTAPPAAGSMTNRSRSLWRRGPFLLPAGLALLAGLDAAPLLLGLPAPVSTTRLPQVHGMLLVVGFVFSAACLLAGYGWLGVTGAVRMVGGAAYDGSRYDVVVHATFLGVGWAWQTGSVLNIVALLAFVGTATWSASRRSGT